MTSRTIGFASYYVTFMNDFSRKVWATPLKMKDQVLDIIKDLHVKQKRETGKKLRCARANNDKEYRGPFEDYYKVYDIRLEITVPKTPQLNDVAGRMNRTMCERIRCMLSHVKLLNSFWGEAM